MGHAARRTLHDVYQYHASKPSTGYAFLNHSATTLPNNLPPSVDDKPLARQRRRRTSPEDQNILEAAYSHDPKPDKAARLELVKRVGLGEKEVQIWFQNRRQTSRRKSRPLLPHEIAQYQLSRSGDTSQLPLSDLTCSSSFESDVQTCAHLNEDNDPHPVGKHVITVRAELEADAPYVEKPSHPEPASSQSSSETETRPVQLVQTREAEQPRPAIARLPYDPTTSVGYLANRRSTPSLPHSHPPGRQTSPSRNAAGAHPGPGLKKAPSFVRLSMTGEGNAKVVTKDSPSPSPERASQSSQRVPHPSNAVYQLSQDPDNAHSTSSVRPLQPSSSGRSRDSRAWEFWCDKDTRSELEEKAEKDSSGSAADAIGLLRSASGRRILGNIPLKRNSVMMPGHSSTSLKRSKLDPMVRPTLKKSSTSSGKLQGNQVIGETLRKPVPPRLKYSESSTGVYIPGNESDKENWSPNTESYSHLRSEHSSKSAYDTTSKPSLSITSSDSTLQPRQKFRDNFRRPEKFSSYNQNDPEADPEVAAFMKGERKSSNMTEEEDLDCVQGLLSLSQGNWR